MIACTIQYAMLEICYNVCEPIPGTEKKIVRNTNVENNLEG